MDLLKILDSPPEPTIIDPNNFVVDPVYATSEDYKILTPLTDFQKELFDQIVSLHYSDILKFFMQFENDNKLLKDQLIIDSLKVLLENSSLVSNHPYLLIDHFFPKNLTSKDIYKKLVDTSGKFKVLDNLLNIIESLYGEATSSKKGSNLNITNKNLKNNFNLVIVSRLGKCMDLIESLLLGHNCLIKRYSGDKLSSGTKSKKGQSQLHQQHNSQSQDDEETHPLIIHLLPSEADKLNRPMYNTQLLHHEHLNLLISFDISVNTNDEFVQNLLQKNIKLPILRLVPNNTIEHIALYFRRSFKDKNDTLYLKPVTAAIVCLRDRVGLIPSELKSIYATDLKYLVDWFKSLSPKTLVNQKNSVPVGTVSWPLPDLRPIENFNSSDVEKSLLKEVTFENDEDELVQLPNHHKIRPKSKISYYKSKRLQGSYITSPIEYESYNKITGISSNIPEDTSILTHKLLLNCNLTLLKYTTLQEEFEAFNKFQEIRSLDVAVVNDAYTEMSTKVSELKSQIEQKNKLLLQRQLELDSLKTETQQIDEKLAQDEKKKLILAELELKESITTKIANKKQENEYMLKEIEKAKASIKESEEKIDELKLENLAIAEKLNAKTHPIYSFDVQAKESKELQLAKANSDLQKTLERNLKKINDIPISQKLRINGVNNHIFAGLSGRR